MIDWLSLFFYCNAAIALASSSMVIASRYPVRCVLFLIITFIASAFLWMLLQAEFLSLVLIFVYVGAVMTLFLYVVMMLNIDCINDVRKRWFVGLLTILSLIGVLSTLFMLVHYFSPKATLGDIKTTISNTQAIGQVLYTKYAIAIELAAVILTAAMVACVMLCFVKKPKYHRQQNIADQHAVTAKDRVTLVDIKSES